MVHDRGHDLDVEAIRDRLVEDGHLVDTVGDPEPIVGGFLNSLWTIRVTGSFDGLLVVRRFGGRADPAYLRSELDVQRFVWESGFPCPEPVLLETDPRWLGAPFMVMRHVEGTSLMAWIERPGPALLRVPGTMARAAVRLHRLPTEGFPATRPVLSAPVALQQVIESAERVDDRLVLDLVPALTVACPPATRTPVVCHLDLNPPNVLVGGHGELAAVVDWTNAHLADPLLDVADVDAVIRSAPAEVGPPLSWVEGAGRVWIARRFLDVYRSSVPVDPDLLGWWRAVAGARRRVAAIQDAHPADGGPPIGLSTPEYIDGLGAYVRRWSGVS